MRPFIGGDLRSLGGILPYTDSGARLPANGCRVVNIWYASPPARHAVNHIRGLNLIVREYA